MNAEDFDKIVADRMAWCRQTLCAKGDEYARGGDRLWNFKVAARKLNCHPAEALAGMMVKNKTARHKPGCFHLPHLKPSVYRLIIRNLVEVQILVNLARLGAQHTHVGQIFRHSRDAA